VAQAFQPVLAQAKACGSISNGSDLLMITKTLPDINRLKAPLIGRTGILIGSPGILPVLHRLEACVPLNIQAGEWVSGRGFATPGPLPQI